MALADLIDKAKSSFSSIDEDKPDDVIEDSVVIEEDALDPDPKPKRATGSRPTAPRVTKTQKQLIEDSLYLFITIPGAALQMRDEHCGSAVTSNARSVAAAMVPIICRNSNLLAWFISSGAPMMDWLALLSAIAPIASTIWSHHVTHSIEDDDNADDAGYPQYTYAAPPFAA